MQFDDLGLIKPLLDAVHEEGYTDPSPIQEQAIPCLLEGKDLLASAQTGTGKTAAFALPILQQLAAREHAGVDPRPIRALVLTPTRELAAQITDSFHAYGRHVPLRETSVFGGVRQRDQVKALKKGVDILVATPGRLLDLMGQRLVKLQHVSVLVLDEADRMLDMGFIEDVRRIISQVPDKRQTMLFSATMPEKIRSLANKILRNPAEVRIAPDTVTVDLVEQSVYFVERMDKQSLLEHVLGDESITRALIFTRTKRGADLVTASLQRQEISADAIHADRPQQARQRALERFKTGKTRVLVASDIASRGIDVDDVSHVINFDLPNEAEVYVHRIGRTARAGAGGTAISFCDIEERTHLDQIERLIRKRIEPVDDHPYPSPLPWGGKPAPKEKSTSWRRPRARRLGRRR
jgi:ATP-dependent RNA helicase RhlE